jgi:hypothetical protein
MLEETKMILEQWGRWCRAGTGNLGYPRMEPWRRLLGSTVKNVMIGDDIATLVDQAVLALRKEHRLMGFAVSKYYLDNCTELCIAQKMKITRHQAKQLITAGTAWVDANLKYNRKNHG